MQMGFAYLRQAADNARGELDLGLKEPAL